MRHEADHAVGAVPVPEAAAAGVGVEVRVGVRGVAHRLAGFVGDRAAAAAGAATLAAAGADPQG